MNWSEISLSGSDWVLTHSLPDEINPTTGLIARICAGERPGPDWIRATVPGDVQSDAHDADLIPDPEYGLDSRLAEWTSQRDWTYCRSFRVTPPVGVRNRVVLRFDGVDYSCHVFLNGRWLGSHEGAWSPFELDATEVLRFDAPNSLLVVVRRAPDEQGQWGRASEVRSLKARFAYGWDWCTRLVPLGIWKDVRLLARAGSWITDAALRQSAEPEKGRAGLSVTLSVTSRAATPLVAHFTLSLKGEEVVQKVVEAEAPGGDSCLRCSLEVPSPRFWYPNGFGPQPIYRLTCLLRDADGNELDSRTLPVGLRRVEWVANEGAPRGAYPYCMVVNGKRVFLKGWNWAPVRQLYGRIHEKAYRRRLDLARQAHCTLLRVWGGGIAEREIFYDLCDERGIMVFQELFQSSGCIDNHPSTDPAFVGRLRGEVAAFVRSVRDHPCLALWCGGNELCVRGDVVDECGKVLLPEVAGREGYATEVSSLPWRPLREEHPVLAEVRDTVRSLDPDRAWLPTSASGPTENASLDSMGRMHDVHGPWVHLGPGKQHELYNTADMLLHSEFGCDGAASVDGMREFVPPGSLWPPDATNPVAWHHGRMWTATNLRRTEEHFGPIREIETYVRASQFVQAEGLAYAMESHRRHAWRCSGAMPWHFAEPWPNVCDTCSVDYREHPKPAYYALARANRPVHVSASYATTAWHGAELFRAEVWGHNSRDLPFRGSVAVELLNMDGRALLAKEAQVAIPAESTLRFLPVEAAAKELPAPLLLLRCLLRDEAGREVSQHWSIHSRAEGPYLAGLRSLPASRLEAEADPGSLTVRNAGSSVIVGLWIEPPRAEHPLLEDNWICLAPGETRSIGITGGWSSLRSSAWNLAELVVRPRE